MSTIEYILIVMVPNVKKTIRKNLFHLNEFIRISFSTIDYQCSIEIFSFIRTPSREVQIFHTLTTTYLCTRFTHEFLIIHIITHYFLMLILNLQRLITWFAALYTILLFLFALVWITYIYGFRWFSYNSHHHTWITTVYSLFKLVHTCFTALYTILL